MKSSSKSRIAKFALVLGIFALALPVIASFGYVQKAHAEQDQTATEYAEPYVNSTTLVIPPGTVTTESIKNAINSAPKITHIVFMASLSHKTLITSDTQNYEGLFSGLTKLVDVHCVATEKHCVEFDGYFLSLRNLFAGDSALEDMDAKFISLDNVKDFSGMFRSCSSLKSLSLYWRDPDAKWYKQSGLNFDLMCYMCTSLETFEMTTDYGSYNISATDMFRGCNLRTVTLSGKCGFAYHQVNPIVSAIEGTFDAYSANGDLLATNTTIHDAYSSAAFWYIDTTFVKCD